MPIGQLSIETVEERLLESRRSYKLNLGRVTNEPLAPIFTSIFFIARTSFAFRPHKLIWVPPSPSWIYPFIPPALPASSPGMPASPHSRPASSTWSNATIRTSRRWSCPGAWRMREGEGCMAHDVWGGGMVQGRRRSGCMAHGQALEPAHHGDGAVQVHACARGRDAWGGRGYMAHGHSVQPAHHGARAVQVHACRGGKCMAHGSTCEGAHAWEKEGEACKHSCVTRGGYGSLHRQQYMN